MAVLLQWMQAELLMATQGDRPLAWLLPLSQGTTLDNDGVVARVTQPPRQTPQGWKLQPVPECEPQPISLAFTLQPPEIPLPL